MFAIPKHPTHLPYLPSQLSHMLLLLSTLATLIQYGCYHINCKFQAQNYSACIIILQICLALTLLLWHKQQSFAVLVQVQYSSNSSVWQWKYVKPLVCTSSIIWTNNFGETCSKHNSSSPKIYPWLQVSFLPKNHCMFYLQFQINNDVNEITWNM